MEMVLHRTTKIANYKKKLLTFVKNYDLRENVVVPIVSRIFW